MNPYIRSYGKKSHDQVWPYGDNSCLECAFNVLMESKMAEMNINFVFCSLTPRPSSGFASWVEIGIFGLICTVKMIMDFKKKCLNFTLQAQSLYVFVRV